MIGGLSAAAVAAVIGVYVMTYKRFIKASYQTKIIDVNTLKSEDDTTKKVM
jgi:hypothetical protein